MITPLEKFRAQYPQGCLIADIVSMHEGQYVVRVAIVQKGETIATGLSASANVQLAEDQARVRAIAALGITTDDMAVQPVIAADQDKPDLTHHSTAVPIGLNLVNPADDNEFLPTESPEEDLGPPIDTIEESSTEESPIAESPIAESPAIASASSSAAAIALENYSTSAYPVDLSDVIAQTDVELTRLGWTPVQGREYLEKTYGKRSRQQLTDEELMSFLLYLEEH